MATYYKYAERSADSTINWAQVGKGMTDMLQEEARIREEKKAAIDEASREYGKTLQDLPSGDFQTANEFAIKFGGKAQEQLLIQDRLLKSGILKPNDYAVLRQNLNDGTTQMFDLAKEYEAEYQDKLSRIDNVDPANRSQQLESALMAQIEGLSNLSNVDAVINPNTGVVSLGKYITKTIDGKEVRVLSDSPNDVATVGELRNRIKSKYDYFDVAKATANAADGLGEVKTQMLDLAKRGGDANTIFAMSDKKEGMYLTKAELAKLQKQLADKEISKIEFDETMAANSYSGAEKLLIEEMLVNPFNVTSILTENLTGTFTEEFDEEKAKAAHAKGDQSVIFYKMTPTGLEAQPTEEQEKMAYDYLKTQLRSKISTSNEAKTAGMKSYDPLRGKIYDDNQALKNNYTALDAWNGIMTAKNAQDRDAKINALINSDIAKENNLTSIDFSRVGTDNKVYYVKDGTKQSIPYDVNNMTLENHALLGNIVHGINDLEKIKKRTPNYTKTLSYFTDEGAQAFSNTKAELIPTGTTASKNLKSYYTELEAATTVEDVKNLLTEQGLGVSIDTNSDSYFNDPEVITSNGKIIARARDGKFTTEELKRAAKQFAGKNQETITKNRAVTGSSSIDYSNK